ncbi:MAG: type II secretion system protein [Candidatus Gottesmanbacteria bacterium]|nr:type II secretion system protein [Candidatus Gottesmanbacteria bacterium]
MKKNKGFTLIELLVSVAIVSGLGVLLAQAFFTTSRSNTKVERMTDVKQNGEYTLAVMDRMIRNARTLTATCSSDGSVATLSAAIVNPDGLTTTFMCQMDGSISRLASVSASATEYLTSNAVTLGGTSCDTDSLVFYCTAIAQVPRSLKVSFQVSQKGTPVDQFEKASTTFQTSIGIRSQ